MSLFGKSNVADTPGGPMPNMQHARRVGDGSRPAAATTSRAQGKAVDRVTIRPSRPMLNPSDIAATALMQQAYCKPDGAGHAVVENDDDFATKSAYFRRRDRRPVSVPSDKEIDQMKQRKVLASTVGRNKPDADAKPIKAIQVKSVYFGRESCIVLSCCLMRYMSAEYSITVKRCNESVKAVGIPEYDIVGVSLTSNFEDLSGDSLAILKLKSEFKHFAEPLLLSTSGSFPLTEVCLRIPSSQSVKELKQFFQQGRNGQIEVKDCTAATGSNFSARVIDIDAAMKTYMGLSDEEKKHDPSKEFLVAPKTRGPRLVSQPRVAEKRQQLLSNEQSPGTSTPRPVKRRTQTRYSPLPSTPQSTRSRKTCRTSSGVVDLCGDTVASPNIAIDKEWELLLGNYKWSHFPPPPTTDGQTASSHSQLKVYRSDLLRLRPGEFLNDIIMDAYLKYIFQKFIDDDDKPKTHIFSTYFYTRLITRPSSSGLSKAQKIAEQHENVRRWTSRFNIFTKDFVVIPINEQQHWYVMVVSHLNKFVRKKLREKGATDHPLLKGPPNSEVRGEEGEETAEAAASAAMEEDQPRCEEEEEKEEGDGEGEGGDESDSQMSFESSAMEDVESVAARGTVEEQLSDEEDDSDGDGGESSPELHGTQTVQEGDDSQDSCEPKTLNLFSFNCVAVPHSEQNVKKERKRKRKERDEGIVEEESDDDDKEGDEPLNKRPAFVTAAATTTSPTEASSELSPDDEIMEVELDREVPSLLLFDSLQTSNWKLSTGQNILNYLTSEWKARYPDGPEIVFSSSVFPGRVVKCPTQDNYSDCGVFVLSNMEKFLQRSVRAKMDLSRRKIDVHQWFTPRDIADKRRNMTELVVQTWCKETARDECDGEGDGEDGNDESDVSDSECMIIE